MSRWDELIGAPRADQLRTLLCGAAAAAHNENGERFAPEDLGDDARIYGICTSNSARFLAARAVEDAALDGVTVHERGLVWWLEIERDVAASVRVYFYKAPPGGRTVWDLRLDDAEVKRELSASNGRQLQLFASSGREGHPDLLNVIVVHYGDPYDGPEKLDVGAPYISDGHLFWEWHERFDLPAEHIETSPAPLLGDDGGGFEGLRLINPLQQPDGQRNEASGPSSLPDAVHPREANEFKEIHMRGESASHERKVEGMGEESS